MEITLVEGRELRSLVVDGAVRVEDARALKERLSELLGSGMPIMVDVSAVQDIDVPLVQVLEAARRGHDVTIEWGRRLTGPFALQWSMTAEVPS